jgi:hypothetical protein
MEKGQIAAKSRIPWIFSSEFLPEPDSPLIGLLTLGRARCEWAINVQAARAADETREAERKFPVIRMFLTKALHEVKTLPNRCQGLSALIEHQMQGGDPEVSASQVSLDSRVLTILFDEFLVVTQGRFEQLPAQRLSARNVPSSPAGQLRPPA